jgi:hypothetical protein
MHVHGDFCQLIQSSSLACGDLATDGVILICSVQQADVHISSFNYLVCFVEKTGNSHLIFILTFDPTLELPMGGVYFGTHFTLYN